MVTTQKTGPIKDIKDTFEKRSEIASMLDNKIFREKMRQAKNESEIESLIHNYQ